MTVTQQYQQALKDWDTLWKVGAAHDMTGGYVDQEDLDRLLRNPTKAMATRCLISQIHYWFQAGIETGTEQAKEAALVLAEHPHLEPIAIRYGYEHLIPGPRAC